MPYLPEWSGPIEGYVVNYIKKHHWRIARTHDHDDAMQECYLVFLRCAEKYPVLDTPQHFMSLFKITLANEFIDMARRATVTRAQYTTDPEDLDLMCSSMVGDTENMGLLAVMVRQAPQEVALVLNLFLNAPQEVLALALDVWRRRGKHNADGDKAVARMLGLPPDATPMSDTVRYFTQHD